MKKRNTKNFIEVVDSPEKKLEKTIRSNYKIIVLVVLALIATSSYIFQPTDDLQQEFQQYTYTENFVATPSKENFNNLSDLNKVLLLGNLTPDKDSVLEDIQQVKEVTSDELMPIWVENATNILLKEKGVGDAISFMVENEEHLTPVTYMKLGDLLSSTGEHIKASEYYKAAVSKTKTREMKLLLKRKFKYSIDTSKGED
jgi:predicted negative regulator of RcsB-dependent stress response